MALSRLHPWKWFPLWKWWAGGAFRGQGKGEEPLISRIQLQGSHPLDDPPPTLPTRKDAREESLGQEIILRVITNARVTQAGDMKRNWVLKVEAFWDYPWVGTDPLKGQGGQKPGWSQQGKQRKARPGLEPHVDPSAHISELLGHCRPATSPGLLDPALVINTSGLFSPIQKIDSYLLKVNQPPWM
ncbi:hypothetical protein HJG60_009732 [Phyllostomus discolor]|uniref:Uncharacterized protein n=1 Tax=Phyllostomus discolor TaxID=89673 RepID=A0A834EQ69_9CHIR|nr:hypothetical protein HJG60_009732 [Phyllostomus discolor]